MDLRKQTIALKTPISSKHVQATPKTNNLQVASEVEEVIYNEKEINTDSMQIYYIGKKGEGNDRLSISSTQSCHRKDENN